MKVNTRMREENPSAPPADRLLPLSPASDEDAGIPAGLSSHHPFQRFLHTISNG